MKPQEVSSSSNLRRSDTYKNAMRMIPSSSSTSSSLHQLTNPRSFAAVTAAATTTRRPFRPTDSSISLETFPGNTVTGTGSSTFRLSSLLKSFLGFLSLPTANLTISFSPCKWLSLPPTTSHVTSLPPSSLGRNVTGTLFGHRRGHVSFSIQDHPRSEPVLLLELATTTSAIVREMSSGLVRIALECEKGTPTRTTKLFLEPAWRMYCNGRKCGQTTSRKCTENDLHVFRTIGNITVGAGVIPIVEDGEMLYMRAKFERVVGSRDSEAYYMLSPEGSTGGPELSIFLLRT